MCYGSNVDINEKLILMNAMWKNVLAQGEFDNGTEEKCRQEVNR